jgi:AraC family transcriptional regulator
LERDLKLADLAALLDLSQFHFSHMFKQSIGIAPYQYLLQQRIEHAKQLLKQPDSRTAIPTILDIALACGFISHSHFSQQFRQLTGNRQHIELVNTPFFGITSIAVGNFNGSNVANLSLK